MRRAPSGFSMIELMVALAVCAIVLLVALPDMRQMIRRHQLNTSVGDLLRALELTRSQAIARGVRVLIAPADPVGMDWRVGWIVFVDGDGDLRPGGADEVIAVHGALPEGLRVDASFGGQKGPAYVAYNSGGRSCSATSSLAARWGTLSLFQGEHTRRIKINMLGRARVCDPEHDGASCGGAEPGD